MNLIKLTGKWEKNKPKQIILSLDCMQLNEKSN